MDKSKSNSKKNDSTDSKDLSNIKGPKSDELESIFDGIDIPENQKEQIEQRIFQKIVFQSMYSGPLPQPDTLQGYNDAVVNGGERVFKQFENQINHRIECEKKLVDSKIKIESRGQIIALVIAIIALASSTVLGLYGHELVASIIGGSTIVGLVSVFITGKAIGAKPNSEDNEPS
jgi:uncharacterized membrane protein